MLIAVVGNAGEVEFSLDLDAFKWTPNQDARTKARLAQWNDPMGRMMYHFNQQQAWIMRGTMPGSRFGPRKISDEELAAMSLEEQLTELLSRRLVPQ